MERSLRKLNAMKGNGRKMLGSFQRKVESGDSDKGCRAFAIIGLTGVPGFSNEAVTSNLGKTCQEPSPILPAELSFCSQYSKHPLHPSACLTYWMSWMRCQDPGPPTVPLHCRKVTKKYKDRWDLGSILAQHRGMLYMKSGHLQENA